MLCTDCERLYDRDGVLLHKKGFGPVENKRDTGVGIVPIKEYYDKKPRRRPSVFDREDKAMMTGGRMLISEETYWPEDH